MKKVYDIEQLHYYASLFSGSVIQRSLKFNDNFPFYDRLMRYDSGLVTKGITYWEYLDYVYKILEKNYCNEYVYKNTLIKKYIVKEYSLKSTKIFNEFRIGSSIADLAMFNGTSKAFEIKTELDNDKRLASQLNEYAKLMEESYLVISSDLVNQYLPDINPSVGILAINPHGHVITIEKRRPAKKNEIVDVNVLMSSVRSNEYKWMTMQAYGYLPAVSDFEMFDACKDLLGRLSSKELHYLFLNAIKRRGNFSLLLKNVPASVQLLCVSMNWNEKKFLRLNDIYSQIIQI